jgi:flavin reductase (DIM6/NTAB) family NADH-FMN oxidoreductase RutF
MFWTNEAIQQADKVIRLNVINSVTGIKPANLIGTISPTGITNLAVFSSVVHLGSNPPLIGFFLRPDVEVPRHTFENIQATGHYTINHLPTGLTKEGHQTSAKYPREISEFDACGFTPEFIDQFHAPSVKEAKVKFGLTFEQAVPIPLNGTTLVIGRIQWLIAPDNAMTEEGYIDLEQTGSSGISGLNTYYSFNKLADYPYARFPTPHQPE